VSLVDRVRGRVVRGTIQATHASEIGGGRSANDLFIPTTSLAMDDDLAVSLLELVEILIPRLKARTASFIKKYLPQLLAPGAYLLSLEDNPVEWLRKASSGQ
jgi:hypothetical protein